MSSTEFLSCIYRLRYDSSISWKRKKIIMSCLDSISSATVAFQYVFQDLFMKVNKNSMCFKLIERFICVLYDKTTSITSVNDLRQDLFSKQEKLINSIPPTQVSLAVHVLFLLDEFYLLLNVFFLVLRVFL